MAKTLVTRRSLLGAATVLMTTTLMTPVFAQELLPLSLAVADPNINPVTDSVLKLADSLGYFERAGVDLELVLLEGTPQAVAAMNSGAVDLADISIDAALRLAAENDLPVRGVVSGTLGPPYLIAAKEEIADVAGLAGRSYAIADNGSLDHNLTQYVLDSMDAGEPAWVPIGAPAVRVQALAAGQVDATTVSYGTFLPIANTPGIHIIVPPEDFFAAAPVQSKFVVALESTIEAKREAIQRFTNALIQISRDYDANPAAWVEAMAAVRDDLSTENLTATTSFLAGRWCINGCMNLEYIQDTVDFIYASPDFEGVPVVSAADVSDESFVLNALEQLGAYEGGGIDARE